MPMWKVTVEFTEEDEPDEVNWDTVEVDARTEDVAKEMAEDIIEARYDVETIESIDVVLD